MRVKASACGRLPHFLVRQAQALLLMAEPEVRLDQFLAAALAGDLAIWPREWSDEASWAALIERANYHGITGLLFECKLHLGSWPDEVKAVLRERAIARAHWELRHKFVVSNVLTGLADQGILAIILKGTAFAYDLYGTPSARERGDTDILVARADLEQARQELQQLGFFRDPLSEGVPDNLHLQEVWSLATDDGMNHVVDLHWQAMNSLALEDALPLSDCMQDPVELPRLCKAARGMDWKIALLHACMHRAAHITSPYIVGGVPYYGGDRLIWANDIDLLVDKLAAEDWHGLCAKARERGVEAVLLDGLKFAQARLGTPVPSAVMASLAGASAKTAASSWLLRSGQAGRAVSDLKAAPGLRGKLDFLIMRVLPTRTFMRQKYPGMNRYPLALLYLRRMVDLVRKRPKRSGR